jgi:hypothetical protein
VDYWFFEENMGFGVWDDGFELGQRRILEGFRGIYHRDTEAQWGFVICAAVRRKGLRHYDFYLTLVTYDGLWKLTLKVKC